ncbi:MAG: V-type ATPase subunit, partial [Candidatus Nanohaloarchaea archaeon]
SLDQAYFHELEKLAEKINNKDFEEFIRNEIEYENLRTALRLKKYGISEEQIRERLLETQKTDLTNQIIETQNYEEAIDLLYQTGKISEGIEENLENIEHELERQRLQKALKMQYKDPLGLTPIIGYIVAKISEVKNLRMLIRAKETGIHNLETIRKQMVMPDE